MFIFFCWGHQLHSARQQSNTKVQHRIKCTYIKMCQQNNVAAV